MGKMRAIRRTKVGVYKPCGGFVSSKQWSGLWCEVNMVTSYPRDFILQAMFTISISAPPMPRSMWMRMIFFTIISTIVLIAREVYHRDMKVSSWGRITSSRMKLRLGVIMPLSGMRSHQSHDFYHSEHSKIKDVLVYIILFKSSLVLRLLPIKQ